MDDSAWFVWLVDGGGYNRLCTARIYLSPTCANHTLMTHLSPRLVCCASFAVRVCVCACVCVRVCVCVCLAHLPLPSLRSPPSLFSRLSLSIPPPPLPFSPLLTLPNSLALSLCLQWPMRAMHVACSTSTVRYAVYETGTTHVPGAVPTQSPRRYASRMWCENTAHVLMINTSTRHEPVQAVCR